MSVRMLTFLKTSLASLVLSVAVLGPAAVPALAQDLAVPAHTRNLFVANQTANTIREFSDWC